MASEYDKYPIGHFSSHNTKLTFEQWMERVNVHIGHTLPFMASDDLPDWGYRDAYDEGMTPKRAASAAIRQAREY